MPDHLRLTFRVEDDDGAVVAEGKDLGALQDRLAPTVRRTVSSMAVDVERAGLHLVVVRRAAGDLQPRGRGSHALRGYPALVDEGDTRGAAGARLGAGGRGRHLRRASAGCCCSRCRHR